MRSSESCHYDFLFLRFSVKCRGGWLPYLGYECITVAADYRGRVTMQIPWLLITVPRKPWWPTTAESCRANAVNFDYCTKNAVFSLTAEACRANAVIFYYRTENIVVARYGGSVPCKCPAREKPCHDQPYQNFMPRKAQKETARAKGQA